MGEPRLFDRRLITVGPLFALWRDFLLGDSSMICRMSSLPLVLRSRVFLRLFLCCALLTMMTSWLLREEVEAIPTLLSFLMLGFEVAEGRLTSWFSPSVLSFCLMSE